MAVRMSSVHFMYNYKNALNRTYAKQQKLFEQADGSKIHRGSDDPVAYSNLMRYEFTETENDQYQTNSNTAISWMKNSDSIISDMAKNISTLSSKANQAANTYLSESDSKSIAKEMDAIIVELVSGCNYQLSDRFLFAGQKDTTQPFTMSSTDQARGIAKTLDAKQAEFFKGTRGNVNTELYQMLTLEDTDGNTYYLDTSSGFMYTKAFVDDGYKDLIAAGNDYITDLHEEDYAVSDWRMSESDALSEVSAADSDSILAVASGTSDDSSLRRALRRISDSEDAETYISQIASAIDGVTERQVRLAVNASANYSSVLVSNYFDNRGVIKEEATDGVTIEVNGEEKTLKFSTIMQRVVTYTGDDNHISMVKMNGATDTRSDVVNLTGQDIWGSDIFDNEFSGNSKSGTALLNDAITVYNKADSCDSAWLGTDGITLADVAHATLTLAQTTIGARMQLYDNVKEMLENQSTILTGDMTDLSGTDVADLATKLTELTTVYNLALSLGGRVLPQSLADYL